MNWAIFSITGYLSFALVLTMPVLWLLHHWLRPRRWLVHIALIAGVIAFVLATINSTTYVNRIQVDRSEDIADQMSRQEMARQMAEQQRSEDVANIRFAEDASGDFLDMAGLDEEDMKYFASFNETQSPEWKQEKQTRSLDIQDGADDLEAMLSGEAQAEGLESDAIPEAEPVEPILMSDADMLLAHRLDRANLLLIQIMLAIGCGLLVLDYVRRLNIANEVYFPLPVPSSWADAMTTREPVTTPSDASPRGTVDALRLITRRGEMFLLLSDDAHHVEAASRPMPRLPFGLCKQQAINLTQNPRITDDFVFETLWYSRGSFILEEPAHAQAMLEHILQKLAERLETRARTKRGVHIVWNLSTPIPPAMQARFKKYGRATGFMLRIDSPPQNLPEGSSS